LITADLEKPIFGHFHELSAVCSGLSQDFKLPELHRSINDFVLVSRTHECGLDRQIAYIKQMGGTVALIQDFASEDHNEFDPIYLTSKFVNRYEIPVFLLTH